KSAARIPPNTLLISGRSTGPVGSEALSGTKVSRQPDQEGGPRAFLALHLDAAAVGPHQELHDPEPDPLSGDAPGGVGASEEVEDALAAFGGDANAPVTHLDARPGSGRGDAQGDRCVLAELEGVREQVLQDLFDR